MRVKDPRSGSPHRGALAPSNVLLPCKGGGNVGFSARRSPIQRLAGKPKVFSCSGLWVFPLHKQGFAPANPAKFVLGLASRLGFGRLLHTEKKLEGDRITKKETHTGRLDYHNNRRLWGRGSWWPGGSELACKAKRGGG